MRTIRLEQPGLFHLTETDEPTPPGPGEALVRVHRVGVCGTDLHAFRGRQPFFSYPRILGHELGVEVVALGEGAPHLAVGDRCAVEPYLNCGHCQACRRGKTNCCVKLQVLGVHTDGGMRELIKVPVDKLHPSRTLSFDQLALVEMLGIGCHAVNRAQLEVGEWVLVIGAGPIGLSAAQFARLAGARVIVMDVNADRLAFCQRQLHVEHCVDANREPLQALQDVLEGDLPTTVFDATGNAQSMMAAFNYVAHGGKLVFVGLFQGDVSFHDPDFHRKEMTLLSSRNATAADFSQIITALEAGTIDLQPWMTHRASFASMIGAFPHWLEPQHGVIKAIVEVR